MAYAYANNDPINKFDPSGNGLFSTIVGLALFFIPGAQPFAAALFVGAAAAFDTAIAGGNLGDVAKSAVISFAASLAMSRLQQSGVFGGAGSAGASSGDEALNPIPTISTQNRPTTRVGQSGSPAQALRTARGNELLRQIDSLETQFYGQPQAKLFSHPFQPSNATLRNLVSQRGNLRVKIAEKIARGHAFGKHVLQNGEFAGLGIRTTQQFQDHITFVLNNANARSDLIRGVAHIGFREQVLL